MGILVFFFKKFLYKFFVYVFGSFRVFRLRDFDLRPRALYNLYLRSLRSSSRGLPEGKSLEVSRFF